MSHKQILYQCTGQPYCLLGRLNGGALKRIICRMALLSYEKQVFFPTGLVLKHKEQLFCHINKFCASARRTAVLCAEQVLYWTTKTDLSDEQVLCFSTRNSCSVCRTSSVLNHWNYSVWWTSSVLQHEEQLFCLWNRSYLCLNTKNSCLPVNQSLQSVSSKRL